MKLGGLFSYSDFFIVDSFIQYYNMINNFFFVLNKKYIIFYYEEMIDNIDIGIIIYTEI